MGSQPCRIIISLMRITEMALSRPNTDIKNQALMSRDEPPQTACPVHRITGGRCEVSSPRAGPCCPPLIEPPPHHSTTSNFGQGSRLQPKASDRIQFGPGVHRVPLPTSLSLFVSCAAPLVPPTTCFASPCISTLSAVNHRRLAPSKLGQPASSKQFPDSNDSNRHGRRDRPRVRCHCAGHRTDRVHPLRCAQCQGEEGAAHRPQRSLRRVRASRLDSFPSLRSGGQARNVS